MTPLIGRQSELNALHEALRNAQAGSGCLCLLSGEAGIGKTRLVQELQRQADRQGFEVLQGNCFEPDLSLPYAPWIDALRSRFAALSAEETRRRLGPLGPEILKLLPELQLILPDITPNPPLQAAAEKYRTFESISRFLASTEASRPSLIILEDLHWGDSLSLEFLHHLSRRLQRLPILVVGTYRTAETSADLRRLLSELHRQHLANEIILQPLTRLEINELAHALLAPKAALPASLADSLLASTDGNPLYVEEILMAWMQSGDLDRRLQQANLGELDIPLGVQRTVQLRLERLPAGTRHLLSDASLIGQRFDLGLLQEATGQPEQDILRALRKLVDAQFVREESASQFAFAHALIRDAVRSRVSLHERRAFHQKVGQILERSNSQGAGALLGELAYHFYQAEDWAKALQYGQLAGARAQSLYAPRESAVCFAQAIHASRQLGLAPSPLALRGRARALEMLGEFESARRDYESALELALRAQDRAQECDSLLDLGLLWQSRDWNRAGDYFERALDLARALGETHLVAATLNRMGNWTMNRGQPRAALAFHQEALELYRQAGDHRGLAHTMDLLGVVSYGLGDALQGIEYLRTAVPFLRSLDDRQGLVNTLTNLTLAARLDTQVLGDIDFTDLTAASDEALQIAGASSWYEGEALALMQGAISLQHVGEYGQALERLEHARAIVQSGVNREALARTHLIQGQVLIDLLDFGAAEAEFEIGLAIVTELGSGILVRAASANLALAAVLQRDFDRARSLLAGLLPPSMQPGSDESISTRAAWCVQIQLQLAERQPERALGTIDRLLASTANLGRFGPQAVPRLSLQRASALVALGRLQEAVAELRGALEVAARRRETPLLWRLHADLGAVLRALHRPDDANREFTSAAAIIRDLASRIPSGALRGTFLRNALAFLPAVRAPTPRQVAKQEYGGLTPREREIASQIARGRSNREIAAELVISEKTAERHVANILLKLGFNSRTQVAVWAAERGLGK